MNFFPNWTELDENKMKRFKTVNTEAPKKPHHCGFVVFTFYVYNSNACTCMCALTFIWTNYMFTNYWRQTYTRTQNIRFCISCQPNQPTSPSNSLWIRKYVSQSKGNEQSGREDKSSGNFQFDGEFILFILENFWHLMGSYYWKSSHVTRKCW